MDQAGYERFHAQLKNGPDPADYAGMSLEVLRGMTREQAFEVGDFIEAWLEREPDYIGHNDDRELILCHFAALVPGCEERFKKYMHIGDDEGMFPGSCIRLVPAEGGSARSLAATSHEGRCGFCNLPLQTLLDLDLTDARLAFLGLEGTRLRIPMCIRCSCYTTIFAEVDLDGRAVWSKHNQRPEFNGYDGEYPGPSSVKFVLGPPRRIYEAHANVRWSDTSQIGGLPTWIQEARYPTCPGCQERMPFVGQVENDAAWPGSEGMTYGFLCRGCKIAATGYQQS